MNLRQFDFAFLGLPGAPDLNVHEPCASSTGGAGRFAGVHAATGHQLGLGLGIGGEDLEQGHYVFIGEVTGLAAHQAADEAAREATLAGDVALAEVALFRLALECDAEIAHTPSNADRCWLMA